MTPTLEELARVLTPKERAFAEAYAGSARGNGTKAAQQAGYKPGPGLKVTASRMLTKANVRAYIDALLTTHAMSAAEVIREIGDIARQNLEDYLEIVPVPYIDAGELVLNYNKMQADGALHLIAGFEFNKSGDKVPVIHSKLAALTLMVRVLKLGGDTVEHEHSGMVTIREYPEGV